MWYSRLRKPTKKITPASLEPTDDHAVARYLQLSVRPSLPISAFAGDGLWPVPQNRFKYSTIACLSASASVVPYKWPPLPLPGIAVS